MARFTGWWTADSRGVSGDSKDNLPERFADGQAVITTGGNLPAKYVIHTVGPIYGRQPERESELLAACYQNSLLLALPASSFFDCISIHLDWRLRISRSSKLQKSHPRAIKRLSASR